MRLVLASTSSIRRQILTGAGLTFEAVDPAVDENRMKRELKQTSAADLARSLAEAKAVSVTNRMPGAMVIGADQVLDLEGKTFDKPASLEAARRQLEHLRGRTHRLETAVCCAYEGKIVWEHLDGARLTMRAFSEGFLTCYLDLMGAEALTSVGAYKLEGLGVQLFEKIEGDYFTILGLPLLPLLDFLRRKGAIAS